ncbi:MAG: hypothetical protein M1835_000064 [Candelina submexicana]|nr:MAG: hypothetical protein M1835_000064 [Candelina submexicana]
MFSLNGCLLFGALVSAKVVAHGLLSGIVTEGTSYQGYNPSFQNSNPPPAVIGWSIPKDSDTGYVSPSSFSTPDIICHKGATPGGTHATIAAGSSIEMQWTTWPESHHGPVITYLANCNGPCESVDKTQLRFVKIAESGLIDDTPVPGKWASDQLIANSNKWTVTIPSTIASGNYVLRHEIIALHSANVANGAQNYPQCINLEVTGTGTDNPSGTPGEGLYTPNDPGISIDIYQELSGYTIPGPPLYGGGNGGGNSDGSSGGSGRSALNNTTKAKYPIPLKELAPHYGNSTNLKADLSPEGDISLSPATSSVTPQRTSSSSLLPGPASTSSAGQVLPAAANTVSSSPTLLQSASSCSLTSTVTVTATPTVTRTMSSASMAPAGSTSSPSASARQKKLCHRRRRRRD